MNKLYPLLLTLLILSCNDSNSKTDGEEDLFNISFSDHKEVEFFKDYQKISDTSFFNSGFEPTHRVTQLKKDGRMLILFSKIEYAQEEYKEIYTILDTLEIRLSSNQGITIGYCEMQDLLLAEIIAIVDKTGDDTIRKVNKAWKANAQTSKIEQIDNLENILCLNEH